MSTQYNVRLPEKTAEQIQELIETTGMTQTQLMIVAIDRMFQKERESLVPISEREKTMFELNQEVCLILMSNIKLKVVDIQNGRYQVEDSKGNRTWVTEAELQPWQEIADR